MRLLLLVGCLPFLLSGPVLGGPLAKRMENQVNPQLQPQPQTQPPPPPPPKPEPESQIEFDFAPGYYSTTVGDITSEQKQQVAQKYVTRTLQEARKSGIFKAPFKVTMENGVHSRLGNDEVMHYTFWFKDPACGAKLCVGHAYVFDFDRAQAALKKGGLSTNARRRYKQVLEQQGVIFGKPKGNWGTQAPNELKDSSFAAYAMAEDARKVGPLTVLPADLPKFPEKKARNDMERQKRLDRMEQRPVKHTPYIKAPTGDGSVQQGAHGNEVGLEHTEQGPLSTPGNVGAAATEDEPSERDQPGLGDEAEPLPNASVDPEEEATEIDSSTTPVTTTTTTTTSESTPEYPSESSSESTTTTIQDLDIEDEEEPAPTVESTDSLVQPKRNKKQKKKGPATTKGANEKPNQVQGKLRKANKKGGKPGIDDDWEIPEAAAEERASLNTADTNAAYAKSKASPQEIKDVDAFDKRMKTLKNGLELTGEQLEYHAADYAPDLDILHSTPMKNHILLDFRARQVVEKADPSAASMVNELATPLTVYKKFPATERDLITRLLATPAFENFFTHDYTTWKPFPSYDPRNKNTRALTNIAYVDVQRGLAALKEGRPVTSISKDAAGLSTEEMQATIWADLGREFHI